MITLEQLQEIMPYAHAKANLYVLPLNDAMEEFCIDTPLCQASFLAQIAHESGQFRYAAEIASGAAYEGRLSLGNTQPGDGRKFKGHGLIQITGRTNHQRCGDALGYDLIENPRLLEEPIPACRSAAWFWAAHGLNEIVKNESMPMIARQKAICRRINGGLNGIDDRLQLFAKACEVLL